MASPIVRFIAGFMIERPARNAGAQRLIAALEASLATLTPRYAAAADPVRAAATLTHLIGIERWGQQRLRVALGEATFVRDGHRDYLPPDDLAYPALRDLLPVVRGETIRLARAIATRNVGETRVEHNSLGPITAAGWLHYLRLHGDLESRRVRTR
jgi:hypothetical protein